MESLVESTEKAIEAATHLTDMDAGAVQALRSLAWRIDNWDELAEMAIAQADEGSRPALPANDNTALPTYLKYCDQLGLTPAGREALKSKKETKGGKLTALRSSVKSA